MKKIYVFIILAIVAYTFKAQAAVYTYIDYDVNSSLTYTIDWDAADTTVNPCYKLKDCQVRIDMWDLDKDIYLAQVAYAADSTFRSCGVNATTIGALSSCFQGDYSIGGNTISFGAWPVTGKITDTLTSITGARNTRMCVKVRYATTNSNGFQQIPGLVCGLAPAPIGQCSYPDSIELNHGITAASSINGDVTAKQFIIECNQELNGAIALTGLDNGRIKISDNLYSIISINQKEINGTPTPFDFLAGGNTLTVTSELQSSGIVSAGEHSSQSILILSLN